jgi:hypothetical protein
MAQVVEHLTSKHEALSSDPRATKKKFKSLSKYMNYFKM